VCFNVIWQHDTTITTDDFSAKVVYFHTRGGPCAGVPYYYILRDICHRTESTTKLKVCFPQCYNLWHDALCQSYSLQHNVFVSNVTSISVSRRRPLPPAVPRLPSGLRASTSHRHLQEHHHHCKPHFLVCNSLVCLLFCIFSPFRAMKSIVAGEITFETRLVVVWFAVPCNCWRCTSRCRRYALSLFSARRDVLWTACIHLWHYRPLHLRRPQCE
jgi:hypothetical protein